MERAPRSAIRFPARIPGGRRLNCSRFQPKVSEGPRRKRHRRAHPLSCLRQYRRSREPRAVAAPVLSLQLPIRPVPFHLYLEAVEREAQQSDQRPKANSPAPFRPVRLYPQPMLAAELPPTHLRPLCAVADLHPLPVPTVEDSQHFAQRPKANYAVLIGPNHLPPQLMPAVARPTNLHQPWHANVNLHPHLAVMVEDGRRSLQPLTKNLAVRRLLSSPHLQLTLAAAQPGLRQSHAISCLCPHPARMAGVSRRAFLRAANSAVRSPPHRLRSAPTAEAAQCALRRRWPFQSPVLRRFQAPELEPLLKSEAAWGAVVRLDPSAREAPRHPLLRSARSDAIQLGTAPSAPHHAASRDQATCLWLP